MMFNRPNAPGLTAWGFSMSKVLGILLRSIPKARSSHSPPENCHAFMDKATAMHCHRWRRDPIYLAGLASHGGRLGEHLLPHLGKKSGIHGFSS